MPGVLAHNDVGTVTQEQAGRMDSRVKGFTLIELLVVIAIVAILAAVLFPVIAGAKARANQTMCSNNMRQIIMAMLNYAEDWHGCLPGLNVYGDLVQTDGKKVNKGPLWRYVKAQGVFCCPDDLLHRKSGWRYTYTMNGYMTYAESDRTLANKAGVPLSRSRRASRTILIVDENTHPTKNAYSVNDALFIWSDATGDRHPQMGTRRLKTSTGSANVAYLDSHMGVVPGLLVWNDDVAKPGTIFYR